MRIDAGGKQCPIPVIMAKKELEAGEQDVEIIVDGPTQVGNLERLGDALGRKATSEAFGESSQTARRSKAQALQRLIHTQYSSTQTLSEQTAASSAETSQRWLSSHSASPREFLHTFSL